jgi:hypothetical protein
MSNEKDLPKCPKCGKSDDVIWDESTATFVCMNVKCGAEWYTKERKIVYVSQGIYGRPML